MYIEGLDALDNKILTVIENNARLTYSDIGKLRLWSNCFVISTAD